jgi:lipopolysaccharide/colanic/teichoic acid biosynthesis glycosyltransferase
MAKRTFDLFFSAIGLVLFLPLFVIISLIILVDTKGSIFYTQKRVGKNKREFNLLKFRTMHHGADRAGLLTIGEQDSRITKSGKWLRKYKLDELPQFLNILTGDMSIVGPRPEVKKYVNLYSNEQMRVLSVRPGLTDYASLKYIDENKILNSYPDPEKAYVEIIMPAKLKLNLQYIEDKNLINDLGIIFQTLVRIIR